MATDKERKMHILHVRVPVELKAAIDRIAAQERRTIAATVQLALERYVEEQERLAAKGRR